MNTYADRHPRLFAFVSRVHQLTDPWHKSVLCFLAIAELCLCAIEYHSFTPNGRILIWFAFPFYVLLFHFFMEEDFRAKVLSSFRRYFY
jgi:hypothetical protein